MHKISILKLCPGDLFSLLKESPKSRIYISSHISNDFDLNGDDVFELVCLNLNGTLTQTAWWKDVYKI